MPRKPYAKRKPIRAEDGIREEFVGGDARLEGLRWTPELSVPQMAAAQYGCEMVIDTLVGLLPKKYVERAPGVIRLHDAEGATKSQQAQMALLALMLSTIEALVDASMPLHLEPAAGGVIVTHNAGPVMDKRDVN